ncbi:hypothetical protein [Synechocystis salina]|nr:hypothetical protein [Synechocystis salina]
MAVNALKGNQNIVDGFVLIPRIQKRAVKFQIQPAKNKIKDKE